MPTIQIQLLLVYASLIASIPAMPIALSGSHVCPPIRSKTQWGGRLASYVSYQVRPVSYAIIHHTASDACENFVECARILREMQTYQMNELNYDDIAYNFLIGNDGVVYKGRGWGTIGLHASGFNERAIGIAFIGSFQSKLPSPMALNAAKQLLVCAVQAGELLHDYTLIAGLQVTETKNAPLALYDNLQQWPAWSPVS